MTILRNPPTGTGSYKIIVRDDTKEHLEGSSDWFSLVTSPTAAPTSSPNKSLSDSWRTIVRIEIGVAILCLAGLSFFCNLFCKKPQGSMAILYVAAAEVEMIQNGIPLHTGATETEYQIAAAKFSFN